MTLSQAAAILSRLCIVFVCFFLAIAPQGKFFGILYLDSHIILIDIALSRAAAIVSRLYNDARSIGDHSFVCFFFERGYFLRRAIIFLRGNIFFLLFRGHVDLTDQKSDIQYLSKFGKSYSGMNLANKNCDHYRTSIINIYSVSASFQQLPRRGNFLGVLYPDTNKVLWQF